MSKWIRKYIFHCQTSLRVAILSAMHSLFFLALSTNQVASQTEIGSQAYQQATPEEPLSEREKLIRATLAGKTVFQTITDYLDCGVDRCEIKKIAEGQISKSADYLSEDGRLLTAWFNEKNEVVTLQKGYWYFSRIGTETHLCQGYLENLLISSQTAAQVDPTIWCWHIRFDGVHNAFSSPRFIRDGAVVERDTAAAKRLTYLVSDIRSGNEIWKLLDQLGEDYANLSETSWESKSEVDPMTDASVVTVQSIQQSGDGTIGFVEGSCVEDRRVRFTALVVDKEGKPTVSIRNDVGGNEFGAYAGELRVNSQTSENGARFLFERRGAPNRIVLFEYTPSMWETSENPLNEVLGAQPIQLNKLAWRVLVRLQTSGGELLLRVPLSDPSVQKLISSCGGDFAAELDRRGLEKTQGKVEFAKSIDLRGEKRKESEEKSSHQRKLIFDRIVGDREVLGPANSEVSNSVGSSASPMSEQGGSVLADPTPLPPLPSPSDGGSDDPASLPLPPPPSDGN